MPDEDNVIVPGLAAPESARQHHFGPLLLGTADALLGDTGPALSHEDSALQAEGFASKRARRDASAAARIAVQGMAFATVRSKLALAGWMLGIADVCSRYGEYRTGRRGRASSLSDGLELAQFLQQVGVKP